MTSEKGGVIHDVKNEERGRHVKDREEGAYMMSEKGGEGWQT